MVGKPQHLGRKALRLKQIASFHLELDESSVILYK